MAPGVAGEPGGAGMTVVTVELVGTDVEVDGEAPGVCCVVAVAWLPGLSPLLPSPDGAPVVPAEVGVHVGDTEGFPVGDGDPAVPAVELAVELELDVEAAALGCPEAAATGVPELPGIDAATSLGVDPWVACVGELPGCGIVVVTVPAGGGLCDGVASEPERPSWDPSFAGATVAWYVAFRSFAAASTPADWPPDRSCPEPPVCSPADALCVGCADDSAPSLCASDVDRSPVSAADFCESTAAGASSRDCSLEDCSPEGWSCRAASP